MKKIILLLIIAIVFISGCVEETPIEMSGVEENCTAGGGTVTTGSCCKSTGDFPNECLIGACGCSSDNSHKVLRCDCGPGFCFNGDYCEAN